MKKKLIAVLLSLSALTLIGCGNSDSTQADKTDTEKSSDTGGKITVHIAANGSDVNAAVADKKGYFAEEFEALGADYTVDIFANGPDVISAQAAGDIDFGTMADQPAMAGVAAGYGITCIAQNGSSVEYNLLVARTDAGIDSVEDLKGKKVGAMVGSVQQYQLDVNLNNVGLTEDDIEVVNTKDLTTLLESGDIDAGSVTMTNVSQLLEDGVVKKLTDGNDTGLVVVGLVTARNEFIEENKDLTVAYLKALNRAYEFTRENPDEACEIASDYYQVDKEVLLVSEPLWERYLEIKEENIEKLEDELVYLQDNGVIANKDIKVSDMYTDEYWKLAVEE